MAFLAELAQYEAGVYQLETTDPVEGGPGGIANTQAQQLANRTAWLKTIADEVIAARGAEASLLAHLDAIQADVDGTTNEVVAARAGEVSLLAHLDAMQAEIDNHTHDAADIVSGVLAPGRLAGAYAGITGVGTLSGLVVGGPATIEGPLVSEGGVDVGADDAAQAEVKINAAVDKPRQLVFQTAGLHRWLIRLSPGAEGGGNAGADFEIMPRSDDGAQRPVALGITRATGLVTAYSGLTVHGGGDVAGMASVLVRSDTSSANVIVDGVLGLLSDFHFQKSGVGEWTLRSDASSDFVLVRRNNVGGVLDYPLTVSHSTGLITLGAVTMTGRLSAIDGTAAAPAIGWASEPSTGVFLGTGGTIGVSVRGSERARFVLGGPSNQAAIGLELFDVLAGAMKQVGRGDVDSAGAGFRVLKIPN